MDNKSCQSWAQQCDSWWNLMSHVITMHMFRFKEDIMIAGHATCNLTINNVLPVCDILNGLSCVIAGNATCNLTINNVLPICDILNGLWCVIAGKYPPDTYNMHSILIGYYTVDCTILKYIWTSAQMTTILDEQKGESNVAKSSRHEYMGRELFMVCLVSKALSQISFSI